MNDWSGNELRNTKKEDKGDGNKVKERRKEEKKEGRNERMNEGRKGSMNEWIK